MGNLKKEIGSGVFYTALSKYSDIVISIIISAILARLLTPSEFGLVAIVMVFISFFNLLSSFGFAPAIIQNKDLDEMDIRSIFSFTILIGFVLALIFFFLAPFIAKFYKNVILTELARLMSLVILVQTFQIVPQALCRKKLLFKQIGIISISVHVISGMVAILLAYNGFSYYALVINSIINGLLLFIAFYFLSPVKPALEIRFLSLKKILGFSLFQFLFNFINYFSRNADNLLIGKYFSPSALGYYDKAYRLMLMPIQNLTHVITPVLHPVLSKYSDDKKRIYDSFYKMVKILSTLGFSISILLYFSAEEIITLVYGAQWSQSIPVFKILSLSIGIQIVLSSTGSIFQAINRTDLLFYSGLMSAILMLSGIAYGVFIGQSLTSVGFGILFAFIINFFQGLGMLIKIALNYPYLRFFKVFLIPIFISFLLFLSLYLIEDYLFNNLVLKLFSKILIALLLFFTVGALFKDNRILFTEIIGKKTSFIKNKKDS